MRLKFTYHGIKSLIITALIALVFASQSSALAHISAYADQDHEHNGMACEIMLPAAEQMAILPPPPPQDGFMVFAAVMPLDVYFTSARYLAPQSRAPPPRAPPASI